MQNPKLIVRPVNPTDYQQWLPLWLAYNCFYGRSSIPSEITQTTWSRFFDNNEPVYAIVAELDAKIVGLAHYLFHRTTSRIDPDCYLEDLFTDKNIRGQGVGRQLIEDVYKLAKAAGSKFTYWQTHEDNLTARLLYDKIAANHGFIVYSKQI